jgi:hypothetical protein
MTNFGGLDTTLPHHDTSTKKRAQRGDVDTNAVTMTSNFRMPHESLILWLELKREPISAVLNLVPFEKRTESPFPRVATMTKTTMTTTTIQ